MLGRNADVEALILFGPSDHVMYPDFDRMAAVVFPNHVGPFLVRDAGHFLQWEAADVFNSAVRSFCRDLLPRPLGGSARIRGRGTRRTGRWPAPCPAPP